MHAAWYQRPSLCHDRSACHDMSLSLVCAPSCRPAKICLLVSALLFHFLSLVQYKSLLKSKRAAVLLWLPEAAAPCWKNLEQEERKSRREMNYETGNKGRERWRGGTLQCFVNAQKVKPENCAVTLDLLPLSCPLSIFFLFFLSWWPCVWMQAAEHKMAALAFSGRCCKHGDKKSNNWKHWGHHRSHHITAGRLFDKLILTGNKWCRSSLL